MPSMSVLSGRALGACNASGRVSNAGESIRAFSQSSSTAYRPISLTALKTLYTSHSAFKGLRKAEFSTFSIDAHFYKRSQR